MDLTSILIGFLAGTATGAAGTYLADKYTDKRREMHRSKEDNRLWKDIEGRFPAVISEMREDFRHEKNSNIRAFFVKDSRTSIGFLSEPCFEYNTDKHENLLAAIYHLEQHGFIKDITPGNCPMYRIREKLVDALINKNSSKSK